MGWKKVVGIIAAVSFVILLRPSYVWTNFIPGIAMILFGFIPLFIGKVKLTSSKVGFIIILFLLYLYNLRQITPSSILSILIILVFISDELYKVDVYKYCRNIYAVLLAISMIVFVLVVYVGIDLPNYVIDASNANKDHTYFQYPMLVVPNDMMHPDHAFRFSFLLDEPGAVGTLAAIILLIENYSLKKWHNIIIFISGILSLSLFFFIVSFFFLVILKVKNFKGIATILLIGAIVGVGFWYLSENYSEVSILFENRFNFEDGHLAGDNRSSDSFDRVYSDFLRNGDDLLFGKGVGAHNTIAPGIQTYKMIIYDNGIIYVILVLLFYLLYPFSVLKKQPGKAILFIVFWLALYYQRPAYVFEMAYFFLLTLTPVMWNWQMKEKKTTTMKQISEKL